MDITESLDTLDADEAPEATALPEPVVAHQLTFTSVQDTAYVAAFARAVESVREGALFDDPLAKTLIGERAGDYAPHTEAMRGTINGFASRTALMDQLLLQTIKANSVDMVVCLAAGLDTRPYRLALPASLRWVEVDLPDVVAHKDALLGEESPRCHLKRVAADLADAGARQDVLKQAAAGAKRALILAEGLLLFLSPEDVQALSGELKALPAFQWLLADIVTPMGVKTFEATAEALAAVGAPVRFAPENGPAFFEKLGWEVLENHSLLDAQARNFPGGPGVEKYKEALLQLPPQWKKLLRMALTVTLFERSP